MTYQFRIKSKRIKRSVATIFFAAIISCQAVADDYDLVILNGRVMDPEFNLDTVRNVGVKDGKIAAVTQDAITGKETIDASGHVVVPGFIDTHHHNVSTPFGQKLGLRDGVTTQLELEGGVYPVDQWYEHWEGNAQANHGATSGIMGIREMVLNPTFKTEFGAFMNDVDTAAITNATMAWSTMCPSFGLFLSSRYWLYIFQKKKCCSGSAIYSHS